MGLNSCLLSEMAPQRQLRPLHVIGVLVGVVEDLYLVPVLELPRGHPGRIRPPAVVVALKGKVSRADADLAEHGGLVYEPDGEGGVRLEAARVYPYLLLLVHCVVDKRLSLRVVPYLALELHPALRGPRRGRAKEGGRHCGLYYQISHLYLLKMAQKKKDLRLKRPKALFTPQAHLLIIDSAQVASQSDLRVIQVPGIAVRVMGYLDHVPIVQLPFRERRYKPAVAGRVRPERVVVNAEPLHPGWVFPGDPNRIDGIRFKPVHFYRNLPVVGRTVR